MSQIDWGTVPDWIVAIATMAAAGFAFTAWRVSEKLHETESARDQERHGYEERAVADSVAAWADSLIHQPSAGSLHMLERQEWGAQAINGSSLPVYDVAVTFYNPETGALLGEAQQAVLPPGETFVHWPPAIHDAVDAQNLPFERRVDIQTAIAFRDTAGRQWLRDQHGELHGLGRRHFVAGTATATSSSSGTVIVQHPSQQTEPPTR